MAIGVPVRPDESEWNGTSPGFGTQAKTAAKTRPFSIGASPTLPPACFEPPNMEGIRGPVFPKG